MHNGVVRRKWLAMGLAAILLITLLGSGTQARNLARDYPQTGHTLAEPFLSYYDTHGGLDLFGYPITDASDEGGYLTQYFERERFEYHPELPAAYRVSLGLLGREQTAWRSDQAAFKPAQAAIVGYFAQTQHNILPDFLDYWQQHGGLATFGYPISEAYAENGYTVQWFERARFELHPELPAEYRVLLGLLGRDALKVDTNADYQVGITDQLTAPRRLQVGIAQGGESFDPHYFSNVIELGRDLHPKLIRIDNIYSHYNVVNYDAQGQIVYNWTGLDAVVNDIQAIGAQPLMTLSYTPPGMAASPNQPGANVAIPRMDVWEQLVYDTVYHYNVEQKRNIEYWEVWNEPNLWDFWHGSLQDYFLLYDAAQRGAVRADPMVKLGGPATANFSTEWLAAYAYHCANTAARCDFLDWHNYGLAPNELSANIHKAREIIARYPQLSNMATMMSEWNVQSGGPNDTSMGLNSDTPYGAANLLATLDAQERAGLNWSLPFELKDGYREGKAYWGRWGVLNVMGGRKPIYHALQVYQQLATRRLYVDMPNPDVAGAIAAPNTNGVPTIMTWYRNDQPGSLRISIAEQWAKQKFDVYLIDAAHANPAVSGDDEMRYVTSITLDRVGGFSFKLTGAAVIILIPAQPLAKVDVLLPFYFRGNLPPTFLLGTVYNSCVEQNYSTSKVLRRTK